MGKFLPWGEQPRPATAPPILVDIDIDVENPEALPTDASGGPAADESKRQNPYITANAAMRKAAGKSPGPDPDHLAAIEKAHDEQGGTPYSAYDEADYPNATGNDARIGDGIDSAF